MGDPEGGEGTRQLTLPQGDELRRTRLHTRDTGHELAPFTTRGRDDVHLYPLRDEVGDERPGGQGLVVGVGVDEEDATGAIEQFHGCDPRA